MTAALILPERNRGAAIYSTRDFGAPVRARSVKTFTSSGSGITTVSGLPVFRSGTFRNSMGIQATWEGLHMDQMVSHFDMLRGRGIFSDVPVRDGHPGFLMSGTPGTGKVVGYHTALSVMKLQSPVDGKEYDYLLADFEILDPDAQRSYESGLFRNRSSEVGEYVTNDEATFYPVYMGVAFVDVPAVEGLNGTGSHAAYMHGFSKETEDRKFTIYLEENPVTAPQLPVPGQHAAPVQTPPVTDPATVTPPTQAPAPVQVPAPAAHAFTVAGRQTSDYAAVQEYIKSLETFRSGAAEKERKDFVSQLAREGKITAPQIPALEAYASSLKDDEQFKAWQGTFGLAPVAPVLGQFEGTTNPTGDQNAAEAKKNDEIDIARQILQHHKTNGWTKEKIQASPSYKKFMALTDNKGEF